MEPEKVPPVAVPTPISNPDRSYDSRILSNSTDHGMDEKTETSSLIDDVKEAHSRKKTNDILNACRWRDLAGLRSLADSSGGFLTDSLRQKAWPILLGIGKLDKTINDRDSQLNHDQDTHEPKTSLPDTESWRHLPPHPDEEQVQLDVNRSFVYYPHNETDAQIDTRKSELSSLIVEVLRRYPYLCYFQGYHDICQVFLLVLEPQWRAQVVARLSVLRIRDFMLPSLGPTTSQLRLLPDILAKADPVLRRHVASIEPFYALAGTLTMFAHNIERYHDIARLFDILLAREPVFSVYMFAQIVIDRRDEVLEIDELDMLQVILGKVPTQMDLDSLISRSVALFEKVPPETLYSWCHISSASALKTARDADTCAVQTMEDGHEYFESQAKEIKWLDMRDRVKLALWRFRRPAKAVGVTFAVAAFAYYLRRNPTVVHHIMTMFTQ